MINCKCSVLLAGVLAGVSCLAQTPAAAPESAPAPRRARPAEHIAKLGDPAPALNTVLEWVKGKPVKLVPGTNIFVVVFCTLSLANDLALTNLTALQKQFQDKGVVVVAVSAEPPGQLKDFVQTRGGDIDFTVAVDDPARRTTINYQRLFGQMMLPRAYVVGTNATVLWHGHPLRENMGQIVQDITTGRYNMDATAKQITANTQMDQYLALARQNDPRTPRIGRIMLMLRTNDAPALCDLAYQIATAPFIPKRDVAVASAALDRAEQLSTTNATDIAVDRAILLFQTGKEAEGLAKAKQALAAAQTDEDKSEVKTCIRAMEERLAEIKNNSTNNVSTNLPAATP